MVPSIDGPEELRAVVRELHRDFPWVIDQGWTVEFWGLRAAGTVVDASESFRVRGPRLPVQRLPTPLRVLVAWTTHFFLTLGRSGAGILVAPTPWIGAGAALASTFRRKSPPLVVRVQSRTASRALMVRRSRLRYHTIEALERFVLRRAELVIPMGGFTTDRARDAGVPDEKMLLLPFPPGWRDSAGEPPSEDDRQGELVVCGARLAREKGVDVLLEAFAGVARRFPDARLAIAGDGPERASLEQLAHRLDISSRVVFAGWLSPPEMWRLLASAGVAVLPSRLEEGFGMFLLEAALAGCALVGSDLGGIRDTVRPGETGLLVPPDDPAALADALISCLSAPDERARFARAARKRAESYVEQREAALDAVMERIDDMRSAGRAR